MSRLHQEGVLCSIPGGTKEKLEEERRDLISQLQYVRDECERLGLDFNQCLKYI